MTFIVDKHQFSVSPALAPRLREEGEFDGGRGTEAALNIGLINNMPDSALQATERQFTRLLKASAGNRRIDLHCFSLPSVHRSQTAKRHIDGHYTDIAQLGRLQLDGLIVTGAEPKAATLAEESFWQELIEIVDWAEANTRSTIWSCLAAHAAVLHLDGIERQQLDTKCSGVYDCAKVEDDWLTRDIPSPLKVSHSRLNGLRKRDLMARGYQILTHSQQAGVDIFAKQLRSYFVFFQGHPEYDTLSLQREYLRDISRFLAGEQDAYPAVPAGYFDAETEKALASYQQRASAERKAALSAELPALKTRPDIAAGTAATVIFKNWLGYLSAGAMTIMSSAARGTRP